jgi:hypothetical protein
MIKNLSNIKEKKAFDQFREDEIKSSYKYFKKYFQDSIFLSKDQIRAYAIKKALEKHRSNLSYLEFGVFKGKTINLFSKILKKYKAKIYGFDSFEGLNEDWVGTRMTKKFFSNNGKIPNVHKNCFLIKGRVQDTLDDFLKKNKNLKINFLHMDLDTYPSTKYVLKKIKKKLANNAIILFDELYNMEGWRVGEFKALTEEFKKKEYKYLAFSSDREQVVIQYKSK